MKLSDAVAVQSWPDFALIHEANLTGNKSLQATINAELEHRYGEIREKLEEFEANENR